MIIRSLRKAWPIVLLVTLFYLYFIHGFLKGPLIVPPRLLGFMDRTELSIAVLIIPLVAFILPNKFEIELSLTCGMKTTTLFFTKVLPMFLYTIIPALAFVLLYRYVPYDGSERAVIGIYIPDNYKLYVMLSAFVTVLFFFSLICFLRVISRNCYVPILMGLGIHLFFQNNCKSIQGGTNIKRCIFDPFISVYILGDTVPGNIAAYHPEMGVSAHAWTYNRLIFLGISIVLLAATYLLLRREKLHKGFGE